MYVVSVIPSAAKSLKKVRQKDHEVHTSTGYMASPCPEKCFTATCSKYVKVLGKAV